MSEDKKQSQLLDDGEYRKLFGLDIYLTPVFSISSIIIVVFVAGVTRLPRSRDGSVQKYPRVAHDKSRLVFPDCRQPHLALLPVRSVLAPRQGAPRRS